MYWGDDKIRDWAENCGIDPFDPKLINPASIDLRLGKDYRRPEQETWSKPIEIPESGIYMGQNDFLLFHSLEYVKIPNDAVAFLYLKSSTGRMCLEHLHAGYIDPGFEGELTFEITCHWPYGRYLRAGQLFCQMSLACVDNVLIPYCQTGHYQGQCGPTPEWSQDK